MRMLMTTGAIAALALTATACSKGSEDKTAAAPDTAPAASAPAASASVADIPRPRAGMWRMTAEMPDMAVKMPPTDTCLTAEQVANPDWATQKPPNMDCSGMKTGYAGGVITSHGVCRDGERTMTMNVKATGDFANRYRVESTTLLDPPTPGLKNPMRMVISGERVGDC